MVPGPPFATRFLEKRFARNSESSCNRALNLNSSKKAKPIFWPAHPVIYSLGTTVLSKFSGRRGGGGGGGERGARWRTDAQEDRICPG